MLLDFFSGPGGREYSGSGDGNGVGEMWDGGGLNGGRCVCGMGICAGGACVCGGTRAPSPLVPGR